MKDLERMLAAMEHGKPQSAEALLPLVYQELRGLARSMMAREKPGQTLQPTSLVHEAWLRLAKGGQTHFDSRAHFFAAAAEAMRRILVERARRRLAVRHGAGQKRVTVSGLQIAAPAGDEELLAVHEALDRLAQIEPKKAELVKLRYFVGLSHEEAAEVLGVSVPTAKRWWTYARAWLFQEVKVAKAEKE